ncbi:MAG: hypothetical protein AAF638_07580 [Pseudomonadota bacterium]
MKTFITLAIAATALTTTALPSQAAVSTLGGCYNHVISICNKNPNTDAAHSCANSGMDACDEEFGNQSQSLDPAAVQRLRGSTMKKIMQKSRSLSTVKRATTN